MFYEVLEGLADFFEGRKLLAVGLVVVVACALGFGVGYATVPVFRQVIAGQGEIVFTGNVEFLGVDVVNASALNMSVFVAEAGDYKVSLDVDGDLYAETVAWGVGVQSLVFDGVVLPECPFVIRIKVFEV